ncbi:SGNH/GDSL hydrolase family protein [Mucilaginibacter phyllosphaerae]|uniref:G-D-S-L family lipolytic protein n=1 Tax=Mucilaginibacter phyllosphaerae TaxID=1812349 RepID=A0A4Y8A661_9SPHI|nr:SGNH/GDSL hydrolase family protein [Mucilaginibacter phyllosphaerae]MBB3971126.1 lysophospholipase L1-like esterase [Mucilaginibacter phyllosphaerae]TEW63856.1 G-D-S-L family lipolytic protein [Mucilaginibacter phyllosphaerae]GGH22630.1 outer membrane protein [Mucilaginibacter phyllosphaerae]
MKNFKLYFYVLLAAGFVACKPSFETPKPSAGTADFSKYIAVGNSLTAGYADGGLYLEGQENSYPSIIAKQMQAAGGGTFTQPLFNQAQANGSGYLRLTGFTATGSPVTALVTDNTAVTGQTAIPGFGNVTTYAKYSGTDINNYGVPGIKLLHITLASYGNLNGFYERLLPGSIGTHTTPYIDFVTAKPFTFFSNWLGNNDALGYATSGGAGDVLTDKATFAALYNLAMGKLTAAGQKGVVATIPDVTAIPYFNTVTVAAILAGVQKANPQVQAIYINAKTAADGTTTYAPRVATAQDMIVLTFPTAKIGTMVSSPAGMLPYGLTPYTPIENQYVLDNNEVTLTKDYVNAYNSTIVSVAGAKGIAVNDMYTFLNNVKAHGLVVDGVSLNSGYISGGLFSLDGVHLTPKGYAIVANEFIKAINKKYNSSIPLANVSAYRSVKFP